MDQTHEKYNEALHRRNLRGVSRQIPRTQTDQARTVDVGGVGTSVLTPTAEPADAPTDELQRPPAPAWRNFLTWMYRVFVAEHWRL